jgi:hypothetical protein
MVQPFLLAKSDKEIYMLPQMSNRHGLIAGATGIIRGVLGSVLGGSTSRRRY